MNACRIALFSCAALLFPFLSQGCVQVEIAPTLLPDGSGKLVFQVAFKKVMEGMGAEGMKNPMEDFENAEKMERDSEGFVAWAVSDQKKDGEWTRVTMTGYFEDINKVKMYNEKDGERKVGLAFEYKKDGEGGALSFLQEMTNDLPGAGEEAEGEEENEAAQQMAEAMMEMMKPMLEDLKIAFTFTVPGTITESGGVMSSKGRTAEITVDGPLLLDAMAKKEEAKKKLESMKTGPGKLVWKKNETTQQEVDAFRKEMAEAKVKWEETKKKGQLRKHDGDREKGKEE